jgi:DNA-binding NtrC family response regulator
MVRNAQIKATILIVDDVPENISLLLDFLSYEGFRVLVAEDGESAIEQVSFANPDLILLDIMMPGIDGYETCKRLKSNSDTKDIPIIFLTALTDTYDKVKGFESGGVDFVSKPIMNEEVLIRINTHLNIRKLSKELQEVNKILEDKVAYRTSELLEKNEELRAEVKERKSAQDQLRKAIEELEEHRTTLLAENKFLRHEITLEHSFDEIITQSSKIKEILAQIEQVAKTDSTVLLMGETGTGKELFARALHKISRRADKALVKVNCASLPANLIESELFGHEKGAFTGALTKRIGRFELADRGTIFLDEIADIPIESQAKLLRVIQEGEFERLGSVNTIKVDVRIVSATNIDLKKAIKKNEFREDLFFRLNVFPIELPPLREREKDVEILTKYFLDKYCQKMSKTIDKIPDRILKIFNEYNWPGNIRELENVIERAVILTNDNILKIDQNMMMLDENEPTQAISELRDVEKNHIYSALIESNWIIEGSRGAAAKLGLAASTLRDRMRKYKLKRPK